MNRFNVAVIFLLLALTACITTTGDIRGNTFYLDGSFTVDLLDDEWMTVRQKAGYANYQYYENTAFEISFTHKKSNGFIGANSVVLNDAGQARSLEVHAESLVSSSGGTKLSQRMIKVDGLEAVELVLSGKEMVKYIFLKKGKMGYLLAYSNTTTYFDQYLSVFDKFVGTFKAL